MQLKILQKKLYFKKKKEKIFFVLYRERRALERLRLHIMLKKI